MWRTDFSIARGRGKTFRKTSEHRFNGYLIGFWPTYAAGADWAHAQMGARYVCEYQGRAADPKKAFARLVKAVFPEANNKVVRHTFRHTAATWLMQRRADKFESAGYLGMTMKTQESTCGHHHPDHQSSVGNAFSKRKTGTAWRQLLPLSLPWRFGENAKSLIWMVGATGIEPIFSPKSHPADLPKTVL
jgi:integrase